MTDTKSRVFQVVDSAGGEVTVRQVAEAIGMSNSTARKYLKEFKADGRISGWKETGGLVVLVKDKWFPLTRDREQLEEILRRAGGVPAGFEAMEFQEIWDYIIDEIAEAVGRGYDYWLFERNGAAS